jgi:hypothetical protein
MERTESYQSANIQRLSPEVKQRAVEAARPAAETLMDRATSHRTQSVGNASNHSGNREAMMHTQGTPEKTQEALSPTDAHKGQTQTQNGQRERGRGMER